jgi:hypothetical protein
MENGTRIERIGRIFSIFYPSNPLDPCPIEFAPEMDPAGGTATMNENQASGELTHPTHPTHPPHLFSEEFGYCGDTPG